jgi:hypothetical protein
MPSPVVAGAPPPTLYLVAALGLAFVGWTRWKEFDRRKRTLAVLGEPRSYAAGAEAVLAKALRHAGELREDVGGATAQAIEGCLTRHRDSLFRAFDRALDHSRRTSPDAETFTPEEEAASELVEATLVAGAVDAPFRGEIVRRFHGETSELVWFELLLGITSQEHFLADKEAFRSALEAYASLPEDGEVARSADVASMLVEWAFDTGEIVRLRALRLRLEAQAKRAADADAWKEVLANLDSETDPNA